MRARRKRLRRLTHALVLLVGLLALGSVYAALSPHTSTAQAASTTDLRAGRELFLTGCASCHGLNASGGNRAPSLIGVGAAAVDFQVSTGRMPLQQHGAEANRKQLAYTRQQIDQLAAYVGSLAPGPGIPQGIDQAYKKADIAQGGELFRTNCSQCHNVVGSGGALTYGRFAPSLNSATPTQIYEAMITGPENMPVFSDTTLSPQEKLQIIHYIRTVKTQADPGGNGLGHVGPVTEAIVIWVAGMGLCVAATLWIGSKL